MEYSRIVAVTGLPGLFEIVTSKTDGAIVRSLDDKTTRFLSSRVHNLSHLESIEIYTVDENVNMVEVFNAMKESKTALPDTKDNDAIRKYFEKVYPNMDFERVYASDMKKMVKWFEVLDKNKIEIKLSEEEDTAEETVDRDTEETVTTLEVSGMDTAETAKPKTKKKTTEESNEKEAKSSKAAPSKGAATKSAASKSADSKSAPSKEAKAKSAPAKDAKTKSAKKKD